MSDQKKKVLLVGWDGADWNHIDPILDEGLLPNLQSLITRGAMGNVSTLEPILSPMLWNSIATGKLADKHGVLGFTEPDPVNGGVRAVASTSRKTVALWNVLSQSGLKSIVVNWWASHPAEPIDGCVVSNAYANAKWADGVGWNYPAGTFHPSSIAETVAELRVHSREIDDQSILPFIPKAGEIDQDKDRRLEVFADQLAHCASIQAAATHLMASQPWDFAAVYFEGIDHFCHSFMEYQEPRMDHIKEADFEVYRDVVSGAYRFHDMMLGSMLELIDDDTYVIVCSDHGFYSGTARPRFTPNEPAGPAYWHRPLGMLVMAGPGIKPDERIYGAGLLDIAPTTLTMLGLPIGEDMEGKVLLSAFDPIPTVELIPSWDQEVEAEAGRSGMHPAGFEMEGNASDDLLDQFVALGYVEDPGDDKVEAARKARIENDYNLAQTFLGASRPDEAMPILRRLVEESPWEHRFLVNLARCYYESGYLSQAQAIIEQAFPTVTAMPASVLAMLGRISARLKNYDEGEKLLNLALAKGPALKGIHVEIGRTFLQQRQWDRAIEACERELKNNPVSAAAHQIISVAHFRSERYSAAVESALHAISIQYWYAQAHFILGAALVKIDQFERAAQAFLISLQIRPGQSLAHRILVNLYKNELDSPEKASFHRMQFDALRERKQQRNLAKIRESQRFPLPDIPSPEDRRRILLEERPPDKMGVKMKRTEPSGKTFTLVSGLPRSGTSLMMQMLEAGGLQPLTDGTRAADQDNPKGYYEWEAIKQIAKAPQHLDADGLDQKAIKVISALLGSLPGNHHYKVIFMLRDCAEIAASQAKMIDRLGTKGPDASNAEIAEQLEKHRTNVIRVLKRQQHFECLFIEFSELFTCPDTIVPQVVEFLGTDRIPRPDAMIDVIRHDLYRQKSASTIDSQASM